MKNELMKDILNWHEEDNHKKIIETILNLKEEEKTSDIMQRLAVAYNNLSEYEKAIEVLEKLSFELKDDVMWNYRLGYAFFYSRRYEEARKSFKYALSLNPTDDIYNDCNMFLIWIKQALEEREVVTELEDQIKPFFWVNHENHASVCLDVGIYLQDVFDTRIEEGFEGSGYDWGSLVSVYLEECRADLKNKINMDPEGSMFVAYSEDKDALKDFIIDFKATCENKEKIVDLFSRAILD